VYAAIVLTVALSVLWRKPRQLAKKEAWGLAFLVIGSVVALWASYSRSALLAAIVAVVLLAVVVFGKKVSVWVWAGLAALVVLVGVGAVVFRDTTFVSQVILHEDPNQGNNVNSNDGHAESLADGTARLLHQPFGAGIGSTGSASLLSDKGVIIENHYLFIAHETGWLGLALFIAITIMVLKALWKRRAQWFALAVFASGIGLAVASFVLPVWADDTVSIIWWGMAAIALAVPPAKTTKPKKKARR
jgi:O-antigen ligase